MKKQASSKNSMCFVARDVDMKLQNGDFNIQNLTVAQNVETKMNMIGGEEEIWKYLKQSQFIQAQIGPSS